MRALIFGMWALWVMKGELHLYESLLPDVTMQTPPGLNQARGGVVLDDSLTLLRGMAGSLWSPQDHRDHF